MEILIAGEECKKVTQRQHKKKLLPLTTKMATKQTFLFH